MSKKELILLGAGASKEAGVPLSFEMSIRLAALFDEKQPWIILDCWTEASPPESFIYALRFALGGLLAKRGADGFNPFDGLDVEELFNTIEALSKRDDLEISPFAIFSEKILATEDFPDAFADSTVKRFGQAASDLARAIASSQTEPEDSGSHATFVHNAQEHFDRNFQSSVEILSGVKRQYWVFETTLELMKRLLWHLVWITEVSKVSYLKPLIKYVEKHNLTIASINYDNAVELCAKECGFETKRFYHEKMRDDFLASKNGTVRLLKIHGSIDWEESSYLPTDQTPAPQRCINEVDIKTPKEDFNFAPAIIFGHRNKLTAQGPYLKLLNCFGEQLDCAETLTVIGYSFRDDHLNALICHWLNNDEERTVRVVNGKSFTLQQIPFITDENLPFLNKRIEIDQSYAGEAITKFYS